VVMSPEPIYEYVKGQGWVARSPFKQKWACMFWDETSVRPRWRNANRKGKYYDTYEKAEARFRHNGRRYEVWTAEREQAETND
jgi:hypothetical protein